MVVSLNKWSDQPHGIVQDTVADMAKDMRDSRTGSAAASAEELYQFMQKVPCLAPTGSMSSPA